VTETVTNSIPVTFTNTVFLGLSITSVIATETKNVPIATHYAACDTSNQLSHVGDYAINPDGLLNEPGYPSFYATSPYDCCVLAIEGGYSRATWFLSKDYNDFHACFPYRDNMEKNAPCAFNASVMPFNVKPSDNSTEHYTLMNAYCGSFKYAGVTGQSDVMPPRS
jgi:hypothetical protein